MDIDKLVSLFGKEYRDNELVDFFQKDGLNIVKEVQDYMKTATYKGMESSVYVENKKNGYFLHLEDELDFFGIEDGKYGKSGNYYFNNIQFYGQQDKGYKQYQGKLMNGIKMTDTREELRKKLGNEYKRHSFLDVDIWDNINGVKVFIDYKKKDTPRIISISIVLSQRPKP